jgi:peptidoglycan L-alanyl-D-glutamate endopeptidase CwlK
MPKYSNKSKARLLTCHPLLRLIMNQVIKEIDCSILEGARGEERQNDLCAQGRSKVKYPNSKHNTKPYSVAVDVVPYPLDWNDLASFKKLGKIVMKKAKELGIKLEWGGAWKTFKDYPHYQLAKSVIDSFDKHGV